QLSLTAVFASWVVLFAESFACSILFSTLSLVVWACAANGDATANAPRTVTAIIFPYRMGASSLKSGWLTAVGNRLPSRQRRRRGRSGPGRHPHPVVRRRGGSVAVESPATFGVRDHPVRRGLRHHRRRRRRGLDDALLLGAAVDATVHGDRGERHRAHQQGDPGRASHLGISCSSLGRAESVPGRRERPSSSSCTGRPAPASRSLRSVRSGSRSTPPSRGVRTSRSGSWRSLRP